MCNDLALVHRGEPIETGSPRPYTRSRQSRSKDRDAGEVQSEFHDKLVHVVLRNRKEDIPYPWLWLLFVTFIVACGLTHLAHAWSAVAGPGYFWMHSVIGSFCAAVSVGTAVAFIYILPQIRDLPSPTRQRALLQELVTERTQQKDALIREIHHRIGNQLQIISSLINIEERKTDDKVCRDALARIKLEVIRMNEEHRSRSLRDYLDEAERRHLAPGGGGEMQAIGIATAVRSPEN